MISDFFIIKNYLMMNKICLYIKYNHNSEIIQLIGLSINIVYKNDNIVLTTSFYYRIDSIDNIFIISNISILNLHT